MAGQFTALAEGVPGDHIHYDEYSSLEEGSVELIVERISDGESLPNSTAFLTMEVSSIWA